LDALYSNAEREFEEVKLPSHDHSHHLRVWNLCKELLLGISHFQPSLDQSLVEGILISAFFHDLGMVSSTREDHGKLGSELCENWFRENQKAAPDRFEEILEAIEQHDIKEKGSYSKIKPDQEPGILTLLSMADDLEAFGTIGIYRYAEIYLMRQIPLPHLGDRILLNAESRFQNFKENCQMCPSIVEK
jgi:HD superfamily phosphodiesterase